MCRFYLVRDGDLLEIIGNSKSVPKLQKHFKKMFVGVASVVLSEDGNEVLGIGSKEGEQVWCMWGGGCVGVGVGGVFGEWESSSFMQGTLSLCAPPSSCLTFPPSLLALPPSHKSSHFLKTSGGLQLSALACTVLPQNKVTDGKVRKFKDIGGEEGGYGVQGETKPTRRFVVMSVSDS